MRSKAHWGYDAEFMRQSERSLTVAHDLIAAGRVLAAEDDRGQAVGIASAVLLEQPGTFDLLHLFVDPPAIGTGAGTALFYAIIELIRAEGAKRLEILTDPNAAAFYQRMGAKRIGDAPSDAIPGRQLPLFEYVIG